MRNGGRLRASAWVAAALEAGLGPVAYTAADGSLGVWIDGDNHAEIGLPDKAALRSVHRQLVSLGLVFRPRCPSTRGSATRAAPA